MPRKSPYTINLTQDELRRLEEMARKYTAPYYQVIRARIILLASEGLQNKEIAQRLDTPRQVVSKWRKRFFHERLDGLEDRTRRGRPRAFSPSDGDRGQSTGV